MIKYSGAAAIESRSRGVLDTPLSRGMTAYAPACFPGLLAPNKHREIGGGRATRQPGQVRKEAALTRSGSGRSSVSYLFFRANRARRGHSSCARFASARIPRKWVPVLPRNQIGAECVYLSAVECAQVKFRMPASRDNQVRIDR